MNLPADLEVEAEAGLAELEVTEDDLSGPIGGFPVARLPLRISCGELL